MLRRLLKANQPNANAGTPEDSPPARPYDSLRRSLKPPTEKQRRRIIAIVNGLKAEYRQVCGVEYSKEDVHEAGKGYHEDIQHYQSILSTIRLLPNEILHKIFRFAVLDIKPEYDQVSAVQTLRMVCRRWDSFVENCPYLWVYVPLLNLNRIPISANENDAFERARLRLIPYLQRSKDKPINFTFQFWPEPGLDVASPGRWDRAAEVTQWLQMLYYNSDRWGKAEFRISRYTLRKLSYRILKTPSLDNLTKFSLQLRGIDSTSEYRVVETLNLMKAQNLKHFVWDTLGMRYGEPYRRAYVDLRLPWKILESVELAVHDGIPIYAQAMLDGVNLRVMKFTSATTANTSPTDSSSESIALPTAAAPATSPPPSTSTAPVASVPANAVNPPISSPAVFPSSDPVCLPYLTKLSLCFGPAVSGPALIVHLKSLTLPSLKELEVYWCNDVHSVDLYDTILSLVRRSDTSLERLATENNLLYNMEWPLLRYQNFISLLYHCQKSMTHLDIAFLQARELEQLIAERNSGRRPPMTKLKTLTVRFPELHEPPSDPAPLLRLLKSRTDASRKPPHSHLEDLYIKHDARDSWRMAVLHLENQEARERLGIPFDPGLCEVAIKWKADLGRDLFAQLTYDSSFSVKRRLELKLALRSIGSLKLEGRDSRILIWLGIPALLARIGVDEEASLIERDPISTYRKQAREILDRWKPFLLESFRSSPYRWCFLDSMTSRVKFVEEEAHSAIDGGVLTTEDLDWERILGKGDVDEWAAARKGSAWFTNLT